MTETVDWIREAQTLKSQLGAIERAAVEALIPPETIADLRGAVDHCRTALWDVVVASSDEGSGREAVILASRLSRIQEMCSRVVDGIAAGRVWAGTPGLGRFLATLDVTERCVKSLLEESAAPQSG